MRSVIQYSASDLRSGRSGYQRQEHWCPTHASQIDLSACLNELAWNKILPFCKVTPNAGNIVGDRAELDIEIGESQEEGNLVIHSVGLTKAMSSVTTVCQNGAL